MPQNFQHAVSIKKYIQRTNIQPPNPYHIIGKNQYWRKKEKKTFWIKHKIFFPSFLWLLNNCHQCASIEHFIGWSQYLLAPSCFTSFFFLSAIRWGRKNRIFVKRFSPNNFTYITTNNLKNIYFCWFGWIFIQWNYGYKLDMKSLRKWDGWKSGKEWEYGKRSQRHNGIRTGKLILTDR